MLKYRINTKNLLSDQDLIKACNCEFVDLNVTTNYDAVRNVVCYCGKLDNVQEGTKIVSFNDISLTETDVITNKKSIPYVNRFTVSSIDTLSNSFSFRIEKFKELTLRKIKEEGEETSLYVYFYFTSNHFFQYNFNNTEDTTVDNNKLWIYYNNNFILFDEIEIVNNTTVKIEKSKFLTKLELKEEIDFQLLNIRIFRENYFFTTIDNYNIYYDNPKCNIPIGLSNKNQINLLKEQGIKDYITDAKRKAISNIIDMEKDIYYPVKKNNENFEDIITIKFNLHFRKRTALNWLTESDSYWNGIIKNNGKLGVDNSFFNKEYLNNYENQSDLLSYLDFTNQDVRYQKNKFKKSFIRISFYDSMNLGDQNLLAYSTIYMNSGEAFSKYIRHLNDEPYHISGTDKSGLQGIRVDREYDGNLMQNQDIEDYRLSSQITVSDRYHSNASSEGFYLYLYKDLFKNLPKGETLTVYMKVEFNHAGYGRTVPFMMPYWDKKKWENKKSGIKTFDEIIDDWNGNFDGEYGATQYMKFSYIRIKIQENGDKYIYYLDNDTYGNIEKGTTLLLNLYEAKMV